MPLVYLLQSMTGSSGMDMGPGNFIFSPVLKKPTNHLLSVSIAYLYVGSGAVNCVRVCLLTGSIQDPHMQLGNSLRYFFSLPS